MTRINLKQKIEYMQKRKKESRKELIKTIIGGSLLCIGFMVLIILTFSLMVLIILTFSL